MIHGLAVAAIAVSQIVLPVKFLLLVPVALSLVQGLRTHVLRRGRGAVLSLTLREGGELELEYGDGTGVATRIDPSSTVWHWLMALRLRHETRRFSLFLLPDMLDAESWRRLAVLLRSAKQTVKQSTRQDPAA
jgi:hypothetical protein